MEVIEAIPILEKAILELESIDPSWKNCRECPHSGKCCDGAFIQVIFPEEAKAISDYLTANPDKLAYAEQRAAMHENCYFHDPKANKCLIHDVRPILCRWTPYTATTGGGSLNVKLRDKQCNFSSVSPFNSVRGLKPGFIEIFQIANPQKKTRFIHLQGLTDLHPLLQRSSETVDMDAVLTLARKQSK
ncbi:TPA: YkgJ family cysteine cluster protein [Citrobacter farmeri]